MDETDAVNGKYWIMETETNDGNGYIRKGQVRKGVGRVLTGVRYRTEGGVMRRR